MGRRSGAVIRNEHLSPSDIAAYYNVRLPSLKQRGREWRGPCPIHKGENDNFSVNVENGLWYCHSACGRGGSVYDLEIELTKTDFTAAAHEVHRIVGRPDVEPMVWGLPGWSYYYLLARINEVDRECGWTHTAIYPYFDVDGQLSYVKVRFTTTCALQPALLTIHSNQIKSTGKPLGGFGRGGIARLRVIRNGQTITGECEIGYTQEVGGYKMPIRKTRFAQDGHTATEQAIYDCLWRNAQKETEDTRLIRIGHGKLAAETRFHKKTIKRNIRSLLTKGSLEIVHQYDSASRTAVTYRLFSFVRILDNRAAAGLTRISRKGHFALDPAPDSAAGARDLNSPAPNLPRDDSFQPHSGAETFNRSQELDWWRQAMFGYVTTNRDGDPISYPEAFRRQPPDDEIVRRTAEACNWNRTAAKAALIKLKRAGRVVRSYGFFSEVLPKLIPTVIGSNQFANRTERFRNPKHERQIDAEFERRPTARSESAGHACTHVREIVPEVLKKLGLASDPVRQP